MNKFFDLNKVAFTTCGSSMTLTRKEDAYMGFDLSRKVEDGYYFHPIYDAEKYGGLLFRLSFAGSASLDMQYDFRPESLRLYQGEDEMKVCFPERNIMRFCGHSGRAFELKYAGTKKYDTAFRIDDRHAEINIYTKKCMLYVKNGRIELDAPWNSHMEKCEHVFLYVYPDENGLLDFSMEEFDRGWTGEKDMLGFERYELDKRAEFEKFCEGFPKAKNPAYADAFEACAYIAWSCIIYDNGYFGDRKAILLSKNWMALCASWDNAFHLLEMAETNEELAFDQLYVLFDYQEETGVLPDWINSHRYNHSYLKPPIVGLILRTLIRNGVCISDEHLRKTCAALERIVEFWFKYRDNDHDGIPEYQHGNDSGADNSTVYDLAPNVEAPDLCAYLIEDMDLLSECEARFGNSERAEYWKRRADELTERFIAHSYDAEKGAFVSRISGSHIFADGDAMINYIPVVLGKRLDASIRERLVEGLMQPGRFLTRWGVASESVASPMYEEDSYWRGPIWAPQVFCAVTGLENCGREELAGDVARRFVDMCMQAGCFAECHNALTGEGLRDLSYSWCANTFVYFANRFCADEED